MDGFFRILKERHGIAIEEDVFSLPDATFFSFAVEPPAGGLLADRITLVRTETFRPYLALLKKAAAAVGADVRSIAPEAAAAGTPEERPGGAAIEYVVLASGKSLGATIFDRLLSEENGEPSPASVAALIVPVVAWTELPDGWTAVSTLPQALVRHATHYARGKKLAEVPALADLFRARAAEGAAAAAVFESGKGLLWTYNTLLGLASAFAPLLAQAGVDLAQLPPAEAFEASLRPGFIQLRFAPDGFTLRGRDVLSSSSAVLAATGAAAIAAAVIVPAVIGARKQPRSRR
jgi:hypothetical protein